MSRLLPKNFQTRFVVHDRSLLIDLGCCRRVLSSAPRRGGLVRARYILNHQVEANPIAAPFARRRRRWEDPARYLGRVARRLGGDAPCVGLMTAVSLKQLVVMREETDDVWIEGFFTVGISNAVRAGESTGPIQRNTSESAGTINMVLVTNARLTSMALVGAVQVATESKTAVLLSRRIRSWTGRPGATGTGTDAVVVVSGEGRLVRYSGTHTQFGEMVGRLVRRGVSEGLIHSKGGSTIGLRR